MNDDIICMHDDTQASACNGQAGAATLVGLFTCASRKYRRCEKILAGNPVLNAGGTLEIRALARD